MKFQNILLLLTACLLAGSCSDDDNDGAWFLPRTLQVMDAKTENSTPTGTPPTRTAASISREAPGGSTALRSATSPVRPATVSIRSAWIPAMRRPSL